MGTSTPVVDLHVVDGNTPTLRLDQDGTDGFSTKTYDIAANETNFFIRDVSNGSALPFRIMNNAPDDSLKIMSNGNVGIGEPSSTADGSLHLRRTGTTSTSLVLEQTGAGVLWEIKANAGTGRMTFKDLNSGTTPFKFGQAAVGNLLRIGVAANNVVDIAGDLVISGQCEANGTGSCADYVFEDDYELRSLEELAAFIEQNKHLPNVPSADDMSKDGVSVASISGRLLEKIEELTLYTLQQQDTITALNSRLDELQGSVTQQVVK